MSQPTVLEVTDPYTGSILPLLTHGLDEAMQMQGLLQQHLDVQTDIVFAGVDPTLLTVSDKQKEVLSYIMLCLDDELKRVQQSERRYERQVSNVVSLCGYRETKAKRDFVLTLDE